MELEKAELHTVCAGSHYENIPSSVTSVSFAYNDFVLQEGKPVNTEAYEGYVVKGNSMQFCGIHTDDLVFVKKGFCLSDLKQFPSVVVFRNTAAGENQCQYKLRRAWAMCQGRATDEEIFHRVEAIMRTSAYDELRRRVGDKYDKCGNDKFMLSDFKERWTRYKEKHSDVLDQDVVISTTYDVEKEMIHFSVHRVSTLVGIVDFVSNLEVAA